MMRMSVGLLGALALPACASAGAPAAPPAVDVAEIAAVPLRATAEPKPPPPAPPVCHRSPESSAVTTVWERLSPGDFLRPADPRCPALRYEVAQVAAVIAAAEPRLSRCNASASNSAASPASPTADGITVVEFRMDRSGVVSSFADSEPARDDEERELDEAREPFGGEMIVDDPLYRRCLGRELYRLTFPAPEHGEVLVRAPFSRANPGTLARKSSP